MSTPFNIYDWYWVVGDTNPTTQAFQSATGAYVSNTNAAYVTWVAGLPENASVNVTGAANNGSGLIRLAVDSTGGMITGQFKVVTGVGGTTEANNTWAITVIDGTHVDLQGSTFTNAYTSGGVLGGGVIINTKAALDAQINDYAVGNTQWSYAEFTPSSSRLILTNPLASLIKISPTASGGARDVQLPVMNTPASMAIGRTLEIVTMGSFPVKAVYLNDGVTTILLGGNPLADGDRFLITLTSNSTQNGTFSTRFIRTSPLGTGYGGTGIDDSLIPGANRFVMKGANPGDSFFYFTSQTAGQVIIGQGTNLQPVSAVISGDATMDVGGALTVAKIGGTTVSTYAKTLLDDADAATARSTLGLGTMATQAASAVAITGGSVTGMSSPTVSSDVATKGYVDSTAAGLLVKASCRLATTANLNAAYLNGSSGVGATLTNLAALAAFSVDGVSAALGDRILVKDQTAALQNGAYTVTTLGSGIIAWILTRATDFDQASEVVEGSFFIIEEGTANARTAWIETGQGPFTIGTTSITFTELLVAPQTVTLTGDVTGSGAGSVATTLAAGSASNLNSGTLAAGRMPALTGDVTTSAGAVATTIANDAVIFAKMQNIATDSLVGRDTAGMGDPETISLNATLSMDGSLNLQRAALTGDVTASAGSNATTLAAGSASNLNSGTLPAGRLPALTGDVTSSAGSAATTLAAGSASNLNSGTLAAARMPALTGDVTTSAGAVATTIAANAVTNAKAAQMAANTIKGNNTGSTANAADLTVANIQGMLTPLLFVSITGVNFNSANTDNAITIPLPTGYTRYAVRTVYIAHASASISTATFGVFTSTGGAGTAIIAAGTAITITSASEDTNNNMMGTNAINLNTQSHNQSTIYFRVGTAQGSAAMADVTVFLQSLP